ncbi:MAG: Ferredoxin--NAD(P)(+) reductase (naphthalene dioxygenase ferredoxin-specific) [Firmicutes bacterium]|nr:Ferredoxin--NAD(P)(+) reductase (naphthalene dioxygenase ferredoxin-specific) [Bacillota bacterium]
MKRFYMKTNRAFTAIRRYAWIFTLTVAFGGLWFPRLGLLVLGVMFSLTAISLFKGRYWCGTYCAHGSLFDQLFLPFSRNAKIPSFLKSKIAQGVVLAWFMYNMLSRIILVSALWGTLPFWDRLGFVFVNSYLMVTVAGGILGLIITPRTWCQFCPMGIMQMLMYSLGKKLGLTQKHDRKITVSAIEKCHKCAKCARTCPMQRVPYTNFSDKNQFDDLACIRCLTCIENCPAKILTLETESQASARGAATDRRGYDTRQAIQARIKGIVALAEDVREFTLEFIMPPKVSYLPGQYFLIKIENSPEMFRAYSIAGRGSDREVRLTVKRVPGGYGTEMIFDNFKVGQDVDLEGPLGNALLIDEKADKILLVAGGIGITPFVPIAEALVQKKKAFKLIYGVNTPGEILYDDFFSALAVESSQFEFIKVVANPSDQYVGKKGFVTDALSGLDWRGYSVYVCGSKPMVEAVTKALTSQGVSGKAIFAESA